MHTFLSSNDDTLCDGVRPPPSIKSNFTPKTPSWVLSLRKPKRVPTVKHKYLWSPLKLAWLPFCVYCNILYIIFKMYFGPVVTSGTRVGLIYEFLIALLRPRITHHTILHLHLLERCSVPDITHGISGVLWVYSQYRAHYPGCDAVIGATCALVSCHIWRCGLWYVCHIYVTFSAQLYIMLLISNQLTHLYTFSQLF